MFFELDPVKNGQILRFGFFFSSAQNWNNFFWNKDTIPEGISVMEKFLLVGLFSFVTFCELRAFKSSTLPVEESCKSESRLMSARVGGR